MRPIAQYVDGAHVVALTAYSRVLPEYHGKNPAEPPIYSFGEYELDTRLHELRRAQERLHIEPQVFDVLAHLFACRDRVVTKEELLDRVWDHRYVAPTTLNSRIKHARQAVGDDGATQRVIRTIHGLGFRWARRWDGGFVEAVAAASYGRVVFAGQTGFDGENHAFVLRLAPNGKTVDASTWRGLGLDGGRGVGIAALGPFHLERSPRPRRTHLPERGDAPRERGSRRRHRS